MVRLLDCKHSHPWMTKMDGMDFKRGPHQQLLFDVSAKLQLIIFFKAQLINVGGQKCGQNWSFP